MEQQGLYLRVCVWHVWYKHVCLFIIPVAEKKKANFCSAPEHEGEMHCFAQRRETCWASKDGAGYSLLARYKWCCMSDVCMRLCDRSYTPRILLTAVKGAIGFTTQRSLCRSRFADL